MKLSICWTAGLLVLLSGCTDADWQRATSFAGIGDAPHQAAPVSQPVVPVNDAMPAAPSPSSDAWCQTVTRESANRNGFDDQTRRANFQQKYDQCLAIFNTPSQG